ncbi:MAG: SDR family oxidoreductase [Actinomycetota bacterium]|nr:MAG: SDR family oxidoreductase [Actinomycetota bacterium]
MTDIAITGATGRLGGAVARRLAAAGVAQRLIVRDPARAPQLPGASIAAASYDDQVAARAALQGVRVLFMVSAAESPVRVAEHAAFIESAAAVGVEHIVYTSFVGAAADSVFTLGRDHAATEQLLQAMSVATTLLRDNLYADFVPLLAGEDDVIRGPGGGGRVAVVAIDDIADVAAAVLLNPGAHRGATYELTGPQSLTLDELAAALAVTSGRSFRYQPETVAEAYASRAHYGAPQYLLDAWVSTYTAIAAGEFAAVHDDVERLTGHPATPLAAVLGRVRRP